MTFLDDVLVAVNEIRAEHGKAPLAELPRATDSTGNQPQLGPADECPMVHALGARAVAYSGYILDGCRYKTPFILREFIARYDGGDFPELQPCS